MKTFNDMYVETATTATFTIGFGSIPGKLIVNSPWSPTGGIVTSFASFNYDGSTCTLNIGDKGIGKPGKVILGKTTATTQSILLDAAANSITVGDKDAGDGRLYLRNSLGTNTVILDGLAGNITLGASGVDGDLTLRNLAGNSSIVLTGGVGLISAGGNGTDGNIQLKNTSGLQTMFFSGATGNVTLGGNGTDGDIFIKNSAGVDTMNFAGATGSLTLGGTGADGDMHLKNSLAVETVSIVGGSATMTLGASGTGGDIVMKSSNGNNAIVMTANSGLITLGGDGNGGDIVLKNNLDIDTIKIIGQTGDIEFLNADFAEEFDIAEAELETAVPGTVMCLNGDGSLVPSTEAYDSKVAGIIAGAGNFKPGIVMDKKGGYSRRAVAMVGKVYCYADAANGAIEAGDMLTTSHRKGYAMKATDREKAFGATIGKALGSLPSGTGLIPVLVTLQ